MSLIRVLFAVILAASTLAAGHLQAGDTASAAADPYIWLEDVRGAKSLDWVKQHDDATMSVFKDDSNFLIFQKQVLDILNAKERIPYGSYNGGYVYNFWQDEQHVRGILRRTTLDDYAMKDPKWEVVLDIDQLNKDEGKSWVYKGSSSLPPKNTRCLVSLSDGGKDASVVREYDYDSRTFIAGGFSLPEAKSSVAWYDSNSVIVGTDFGPGSLTSSGYPRITKLWKRGTLLADAQSLLEGEESDVSVGGSADFRPDGNHLVVSRNVSFWESKNWLVDGKLQKTEIPIPPDATTEAFFRGYLIIGLHSDWQGIPEGSLIAIKTSDLGAGELKSKIETIFTPDEKSTLTGVVALKDYLMVSILRNVKGRILYYTPDSVGGSRKWTNGEIALPEFGSVDVRSADAFSNVLMVSYQDFLSPSKLYLLDDPKAPPQEIKSLPAMFNAQNMKISQFEATSADGTLIPYFLISSKNLVLDGQNPTLLYGYGGFRSSETPFYSASVGRLWLERGGVYVLANIRGGGEFGPRWHKAALLKNRQKAFDDFIAIAEDLVKRKITSPRHLGIEGGSNGGLLVGATFTQRPDLFNAVVCQVPLLDMLRYTKLAAGASWIGEYGDPDSPEMRPYIEKYSPYQNVKAGVKYPQVLFVTSTADDRVHPAHARKMTARMEELGDKVFFYEEMQGGHGAAADNLQRARRVALEWAYLWKMLGK